MVKLHFEGGEELAANLAKLSTRMSKAVVREALTTAGEPMRALIAQRAPRAPGEPDLADHLVIAAVRDQEHLSSVGIGPDSKYFFYDLMQEFGTVHHGAQPMYRPAFDEKVASSLDIIGQELWRQLTARGFGVRLANAPTNVSSPGGGGLL